MIDVEKNGKPDDYSKQSIYEIAKEAAGIGGGLLGVIYTAGFLVESIYLLRYGVSDITLLKPRYISIGFTFMFFSSLVVVPSYLTSRYLIIALFEINVREDKFYWNTDNISILLFSTLGQLSVVMSATGLIIYFASFTDFIGMIGGLGRVPQTNMLRLLCDLTPYWFAPLICLGGMIAFFNFAWNFLKNSIPNFSNAPTASSIYDQDSKSLKYKPSIFSQLTVYAFLVLPLLFIIASFTCTEHIYSRINPAFGGGNFPYLQFVIDSGDANFFSKLGVTQNQNDSLSLPLKLLAQSEKNYIVLLEKQAESRVVLLSKDIIKGIVSVTNKTAPEKTEQKK